MCPAMECVDDNVEVLMIGLFTEHATVLYCLRIRASNIKPETLVVPVGRQEVISNRKGILRTVK